MSQNRYGAGAGVGRRQTVDEFAKADVNLDLADDAVNIGRKGRKSKNATGPGGSTPSGPAPGVLVSTAPASTTSLPGAISTPSAVTYPTPNMATNEGTQNSLAKMAAISKSTSYDSEAARQRRLGAETAGLAIGGGVLTRHGLKGIKADTKALNDLKPRPRRPSDDALLSNKALVSRRNGAKVAAGAGTLAAADATSRYAAGPRNRRWS